MLWKRGSSGAFIVATMELKIFLADERSGELNRGSVLRDPREASAFLECWGGFFLVVLSGN